MRGTASKAVPVNQAARAWRWDYPTLADLRAPIARRLVGRMLDVTEAPAS